MAQKLSTPQDRIELSNALTTLPVGVPSPDQGMERADNLSANFLSVSSITKRLNCSVTFFPTHCVFQDLHFSRGRGLVWGVRVADCTFSKMLRAIFSEIVEIVWHSRLGYLSLSSLKLLFPSKFDSVDVLHCETCQHSKHVRTTYPALNERKSDGPFHILHSDVWGHSPVCSLPLFYLFI